MEDHRLPLELGDEVALEVHQRTSIVLQRGDDRVDRTQLCRPWVLQGVLYR